MSRLALTFLSANRVAVDDVSTLMIMFPYLWIKKVTIIEASERIGGRVETFRNRREGWYAEMGAMRIPSFHK